MNRDLQYRDTEEESLQTASKRNEARYEGNVRKGYKVWDDIQTKNRFFFPIFSSYFKAYKREDKMRRNETISEY